MDPMETATPETSPTTPATVWAVLEETVMRLDAVLTLPAGVQPAVKDLADVGLDTGHITTADWSDEYQRYIFHDPDQPDADVWQVRPVTLNAPAVEWLFKPRVVEAVDEQWDALEVNTRGSSLPRRFFVPTSEEFSTDLIAAVLGRLGLSPAKRIRGTDTSKVVLVERTPAPADEFTTLVTGVLRDLGYALELDGTEHERRSVKEWPADERDLYRELTQETPFDYAYAKVEQLRAAKLAAALRDAMGRLDDGR